MSEKKLRVTLVRSPIGYPKPQKATVQGVGAGQDEFQRCSQ